MALAVPLQTIQLIEGFAVVVWLVAALAVCAGGLVQACTGFGMALVVSPCLMLVLPATQAVALLLLVSLLNTGVVLSLCYRDVHKREVVALAAGGVAGLPVGTYVLTAFNGPLLKAVVGVVVVLFAIVLGRGWRIRLRRPEHSRVPIGLLSGLLAGSMGMGGPPVVLFLVNQETPRPAFRASLIAYFFALNIAALVLFSWEGLITPRVLGLAVGVVPALLVGTGLGLRAALVISEHWFRRASIGLIVTMGLVLFVINARQLQLAH